MILFSIVGIFLAVMTGTFLVHSGYEGGYDDGLVGVMVQALFVGSVCLVFVGFEIWQTLWLYVAIGLSFALLAVGYLFWKRPFARGWEARARDKRTREIRRSGSYREYRAFVKKYGGRIGAVLTGFNVLYAPRGVRFFTRQPSGSGTAYGWNPELGDPMTHYFSDEKPDAGWQRKTFFPVEDGDRPWDATDKSIIMKLMTDALPGSRTARWQIDGEACRTVPKR